MRASFITWYPYCRRSDAIAEALGGRSHLVHYLAFKRPSQAPVKYVLQTATTLRILARERPDLVLVAAPPVFAALPVWWHARRTGARFVVDAHTGVFADPRWRWLMPLTRKVFVHADAIVVTGERLLERVRSWGARGVVIGDVPVRLGPGRAPASCVGPRVVVVNTFSADEPVGAVLTAARMLPSASFFVTGDTRYADARWLNDRPSNLLFTGFTAEPDYAGLLRAADVVVVLTTQDDTMQRGAYEAMSLGKPLVTSDWGLLRQTFSRGTIHVRNEAAAITEGIGRALANADSLGAEMRSLAVERELVFEARLAELRSVVAEAAPRGRVVARRAGREIKA